MRGETRGSSGQHRLVRNARWVGDDDYPEELIAVLHLTNAEGDVHAAAHEAREQNRTPPESSEQKLALAILKSALDDVRKAKPRYYRVRKRTPNPDQLDRLLAKSSNAMLAMWARWWFENPRAAGDVITLGWCCDALGVEVEFIQRIVRPLYGDGVANRTYLRTPGPRAPLAKRAKA